jgi:general stress protein YciG
MDTERQRAIASAGGRAAHRSGHAHEFNTEEAREAGRRGGLARSASRHGTGTVPLADGLGVMQLEASRADSEHLDAGRSTTESRSL